MIGAIDRSVVALLRERTCDWREDVRLLLQDFLLLQYQFAIIGHAGKKVLEGHPYLRVFIADVWTLI